MFHPPLCLNLHGCVEGTSYGLPAFFPPFSSSLHTTSPKSGGGKVALHPHWQDSLIALHMFTWLMLGSMYHNSINTAVAALEVKLDSGLCQLFGSLDTYMEVNTCGVATLATGALQKLHLTSEVGSVISVSPSIDQSTDPKNEPYVWNKCSL